MADGTIPFVRIEALAALGAERLAEILSESARDDPRLGGAGQSPFLLRADWR